MELRPATDPEKLERDHVTCPEWGSKLTLAQYLERERVLREHPFSKGMRTWLLVDGGAVLASCETYDNVSRVGPERGVSWSIASVYVEPQLRGRGHATRLMDLLAQRADAKGLQACVLFSDVGEPIYARSGYVAGSEPHDWTLEPLAGAAPPCDTLVPSLDAPPPGTLQLEPTAEQLDWAHARERLYARFLGRTLPRTHAARAGAAHASWAAYFKSNELIILWLQPGAPEETAAVLDAARAEAHHCGLERVRLWAPTGQPLPSAASVQKRKEELPMFHPLSRYRFVTWRHVQRALWV